MASVQVSTPIKSHKGLFATRTAGGRVPLTPSPREQLKNSSGVVNLASSPFTPERKSSADLFRAVVRAPAPTSRTSSSTTAMGATTHRDSPKNIKCNIARGGVTPRKALELGVSDYTLSGTGTTTTLAALSAAAKGKKSTAAAKRPKATTSKTTVTYAGADRFVPTRGATLAVANEGARKLREGAADRRPRPGGNGNGNGSGSGDGSVALASAAEDALAALEGLSISEGTGRVSGVTIIGDGIDSLDRRDHQHGNKEPVTYSRPSPNSVAFQDSLASACGVSLNTRILQFKPAPPESSRPIDLRRQYNRPLRPAGGTSAQFRRRIATAPERVLDAPGLIDDYYLNLLDWSSGNQVAIGLERSVYIWSAEEGSSSCLLETADDTYVSSVRWSGDGAYVGVGLGTGEVQIWDAAEGTKVRSMFGHDTRVGVMGWSRHLLSTGARSGLVFNHDVRVAEHKVAELVSHTSEVCGLEWRPDGAQLATGGNDNLVAIWDARSVGAPKFTKTNHRAAVKALAWCPWNMSLLATGGGSHDRHIHFWNSTSGARVNSIDTGSQVTSLRWSTHYREIVSSSGFPDNSLSIWSYPTLVRNVEIPAHESRVLHSCLSPDGQMLATAAADESLKFWKLFEKKPGSVPVGSGGSSSKTEMAKQMTIR